MTPKENRDAKKRQHPNGRNAGNAGGQFVDDSSLVGHRASDNCAQESSYSWQSVAFILLFCLLGIWVLDVFYVVEDTNELKQPAASQTALLPEIFEPTIQQALSQMRELSLPAVPVFFKVAATESDSLAQKQVAHEKTKLLDTQTNHTQASQTQIEQVMQQLANLNTEQIQFLLPQSATGKDAFLKHMYQCENMQFGTISQTIPYKLSILSAKRSSNRSIQASSLLRVAHDYISEDEGNLLTIYGQGGRPVRIFPVSLDAQLSANISAYLMGSPLQSFVAEYFLQGSQIGLKDISINHKAIREAWIISPAGCF